MNNFCAPGFEPARAKLHNIIQRAPAGGGAALSVYHRGQCVVDIWGGSRNENLDPWQQDTLSISFSTSKGIITTLIHILVDKGLLEYDDKVSTYWPEFAQNGKSEITIRQLLCHEAGLYKISDMIEGIEEIYCWDTMIDALARARPVHVPGMSHGYHGLTYGWLIGEVIQRVTKKKLSQVLNDELVQPLGLDGLFIGLPDEHMERAAQLMVHNVLREGLPKALSLFLKIENAILKTLTFDKFNLDRLKHALLLDRFGEVDELDPRFLQACVPAANGMFTARSLARIYGCLANGGQIDDVRLLSTAAIERAAVQQNSGMDRVVFLPMGWRLGYHRVFCPGHNLSRAFGHFGFGGSGAWADPRRNLAMGMTVNSGVGTPFGDVRIVELTNVVIQCAERVARYSQPLLTAAGGSISRIS